MTELAARREVCCAMVEATGPLSEHETSAARGRAAPPSPAGDPTRRVAAARSCPHDRAPLGVLAAAAALTLLTLAACGPPASPASAGQAADPPPARVPASASRGLDGPADGEPSAATSDAPADRDPNATTSDRSASEATSALPLIGASLKDATAAAGLPWPPPDVSVHVDKAARRMRVRSGATDLVLWRVALGGTNADKLRQGDRATPEGRFRVVTRNDRSRFHLFLGLSYPTAADADRGLRNGLITQAQAARIREADRANRAPPWETPLGGAIGLHGGGAGADWTLGCVAVEDAQIEELWDAAPLGTVVTIGP